MKTIQSQINTIKSQIEKLNQSIIKYTRFDKNGSHREAIVKLMDKKKVLVLKLNELENQLNKNP
jgi:hypothetical protein